MEVALIYVKKKAAPVKCATFENFQKSIVTERKQLNPQCLLRYGEIFGLIDSYRAEVKSALRLFDEINNYNSICRHEPYHEIFKIELTSRGAGRAGIVKAINYNYWYALLHSEELERLLTAGNTQPSSAKWKTTNLTNVIFFSSKLTLHKTFSAVSTPLS